MENERGSFIEKRGDVSFYENGYYLEELREFFKLKNGTPKPTHITFYKGYQIKFDNYGWQGFSIWKGKTNLEDRIYSIKKAKEIIDEWK